MSAPEELLAFQLRASGVPHRREVVFHMGRRWRMDFVIDAPMKPRWGAARLAVEVDGGSWSLGKTGHTSGLGFQRDKEKQDAALRDGYVVYRVTPLMVKRGQALSTICELVRGEDAS